LHVASYSSPWGTLVQLADGTFDYTAPTTTGSTQFTFSVTDGSLTSVPGTISFEIVNNACVGVVDEYAVLYDRSLIVDAASGVLANDLDDQAEVLTAVVLVSPQHGTLYMSSNGSFTYSPHAGYVGADGFKYVPSDGLVTGELTTVSISIENASPIATGDTYGLTNSATLDIPVESGLLENDYDSDEDSLHVDLVSGVSHGTLTLAANGSFIYIPTAGYFGVDSFTYQADDGAVGGKSDVVTAVLNVNNQKPIANSERYQIAHGDTLTTSAGDGVLANDWDPNFGAPLTADLITTISPSDAGTLAFNDDGSFTFAAANDFVGTARFTYRTENAVLQSDTVTVSGDVTDTAPVANADSYSTAHGTDLVV